MPDCRQFILIGEAGNHEIQVGDNIEILEAYQRQDLPVVLANRFRINEAYENYGLSKPFAMKLAYDLKLVRANSFMGEIVLLSREEHDLMITVAAKSNERLVQRSQLSLSRGRSGDSDCT